MAYNELFEKWLNSPALTEEEKAQLSAVTKEEEKEDRFYKELEFGTAGLRGKVGMGTNRMNRFIIARASKAMAKTIIDNGLQDKGIAIAHDCRLFSKEFAKLSALVMASNGIKAYLFEDLRPTPELSYAIRYLGTASGINITASHNPKEYNGYKVYWQEGSQIKSNISDKVLEYINEMDIFENYVTLTEEEAIEKGLLEYIGEEVDEKFYEEVLNQTINDDNLDKGISVVYTPLNGAGYKAVTTVLDRRGFKNVHIVEEQKDPDGTFPTIEYPNPEDTAAFEYSERLAEKVGADILIATDPDCDRLAVEVVHNGEIISLNGNQVGALLVQYVIENQKTQGKLPENPYIVKSIVTSKMVEKLCEENGIEVFNVLTGFKNIAELPNTYDQTKEKNYVMGYEESIGYNLGTFVRDKDGVTTAMMLVEAAAFYKAQGKTLVDVLERFYEKYGFYLDKTVSVTLEGAAGAKRIERMMDKYREIYAKEISGAEVLTVTDYLSEKEMDLKTGEEKATGIEKTDAVKFSYSDETWYTLRPSGTEPKVKLYIYVRGEDKAEALAKIETVEKTVLDLLYSIE
ncbi:MULTISPECIES: phospho-sugar mutase [unclassified Gemella]|uniref:phospho-sugar mutase n=1 Tax=unclassified Gemella TaxID=2624949 RepID=UPI001073559F|nr:MULTISPECIES: phospho-sugar mutase [unclassified Gemella]MBF0709658.1 phospho-sugar mutase [Gemella sp. GL1.1]MBF0746923.1 phospho-sugar mutase [Gemella sp. 19428wG2_WT2a]NYS27002.1 phospho-sugar mutase [Gemella sp. GL1]TFU59149.1 phospho-sugar mutase [Gemella sp. WT2a]